MAKSSKLGTSLSVLGESAVLGSPDSGGFDPLLVTASDFISLTDEAVLSNISYQQNVTSALSLTDLAEAEIEVAPQVYEVSAESELELTDACTSGVWPVSASSVIVLTDSSHAAGQSLADAESELSLTDSATCINLHVYAESTLSLTDSAASNEKFGIAESVLALTDEAEANQERHTAESVLTLTQTVTVIRPIRVSITSELVQYTTEIDPDTLEEIVTEVGLVGVATANLEGTRTASHLLSFAQSASAYVERADAIACDAESEIELTDEARISLSEDASSELELTDEATAQVGIGAESELSTLDVTATAVVVRALSASNEIELSDSVAFIYEDDRPSCNYELFIGSNSDPNAPEPPPATYTSPGATPGFRLQYPATGTVTDELELRNPNLGNRDRLSMVRINRETRGGTLIVFADPIWPKVETLLLQFSALSSAKAHQLIEFMEAHIGEEIRLIDHEDRLWRGVITNPQDPIVQDGRGCQFTASFEFEGELV